MTRLCVKTKDWYCNIIADRIEETEGIVRAFNGDNLVGVLDLGVVDALWLSEK